jgi:molecular chaperone HscC
MIVGIDLGTTNSLVAVWKEGQSVLIPNSLGDMLTPSAVSVADDGAVLVGIAARDRQSTHPKHTATAFKRFMGTQQEVTLGGQKYRAEDLSALVLRSLKADAEAFLQQEVTDAVITVPAYFNDKQRKATRRAGELAGLKVERLVNEPTAAALAYGIHERALEEPFLVFDLGGGTFDVSLVEMFDGIIEVRASAGDNRLGGEDFNQVIIDLMKEKLRDDLPKKGDANALHQLLRAAAERTRRALSDADSATFRFVWDGVEHSRDVTTEEFETRAAPLIARLRDPVLRSLRDGNTKVGDLAEIVMVGGSTRMPVVRKAVTRMFGRFPSATVHPDHAVALGAAVQAGLKSRDAALNEIRLTDVCPFTLGVDVAERDQRGTLRTGIFSPIIDRNTVIPASRSHVFSTMSDHQRVVEFGIYQGEARDVAMNVKLGEIHIAVPPKPAGHVAVECRFTYDTSGLLEVDVTVPDTGVSKQIAIYDEEDSAITANLDQRRAALAGLKVHPREADENVAALARAARCYEDFLGPQREYIGQLVSSFQSVLESQDARMIDPARAELAQRLDELEGDRFL